MSSSSVPVLNAKVVATDGDDSNPGTTDEPWRTVHHGITSLEPGQTLLVRGGRYVENLQDPPIMPGLPASPVRVAAFPGETPLIEGFFWLTGADHWTIENIDVTWRPGNPIEHMVKMTNGVGWTWRDSELSGARSFANLLVAGTVEGEPSQWAVVGNCIHDTLTEPIHHVNGDHNLYINTGLDAGPGLVEQNLLFGAPNGENIKLGGADSTPEDGAANVIVRYNTMYSAVQNILIAGGSHDNLVERNILGDVSNPSGYAIRAYHLTGSDNVVRENLFADAADFVEADSGYRSVTVGSGNVLKADLAFRPACDAELSERRALRRYGHRGP